MNAHPKGLPRSGTQTLKGECGIRTHGPHVGGHPSSKRAHSTNSTNSPEIDTEFDFVRKLVVN